MLGRVGLRCPRLSGQVFRAVFRHNSSSSSSKVPSTGKEIKPSASLPPLKVPDKWLKRPGGNYVSKKRHERKTYQHHTPAPPSKQDPPSHNYSLFTKFLPSIVVLGGCTWLFFSYEYFVGGDKEKDYFHPDRFTTWLITYKYQLPDAPDHFIIELTKNNLPEIHSSMKVSPRSMWDGHKLWSIEIMQPEINIVRAYTPLPLYVASINPITEEPFLKIIETEKEEGKMLLYIKKYDQGEMGRWLFNRPLLSEIKVRGPYIDYQIPFSPINDEQPERETLKNLPSKIKPEKAYPETSIKLDNLSFFVAGTGITPALQMLYSRNPPRGFTDVYYSFEKDSELLNNFKDLNYCLEKLGRAKFHYFVRSKSEFIKTNDIPPPSKPNFQGYKSLDMVKNMERKRLIQQKIKELEEGSPTKAVPAELKTKIVSELIAKDTDPNDKLFEPLKYKSQLEQFQAIRDKLQYKSPAVSIVCGPDGYLSYICGPKNLNNAENKDLGPIVGLLGQKGWDRSNVVRM